MEEIELHLDEKKHGGFFIKDDIGQAGEMVVSIRGNDLTVYHTEVATRAEGKGYAKNLLNEMVAYARKHQLKIIPLCPYVQAQFKRHPEDYVDVWKREIKPE